MPAPLILFIAVILAPSAPAPKVKPGAPVALTSADLVGTWRMLWCGDEYSVALHANGSFSEAGKYGLWWGSWTYDADSRTFTVHERQGVPNLMIQPGEPFKWSYKLKKPDA
jgi:hypothetical protein